MEPCSGSLTESGSSKSNPSSSPPPGGDGSFNGLKFGKKIYFEEAKSRHGSSSKSSKVLGRKAHGGGGHQQQPPRCQVEGCRVDLSDVKAYYSRHKVCGAHSKSPKVIVNGLEQRFCQQCSRFHQLPEFDQGKRSCRRRLAGHNERRRKPQPGSALSFQCSRLVSTLSDTGSRAGGFLLDFTAYARHPQRDTWPTARSSEQLPGIEPYPWARYFPQPWQNPSQNPSSGLYLQSSTTGTGFSSSGIPPGECFTGVGVTDSTCALSLLSNQQWASRNQASNVVVNHSVNAEGAPLGQSVAHHGATMNQYPNPVLGYKSNEASSSSHEMGPDLGLGQLSLPINTQFSNDLELSHQTRRQYMELEHSRGYGSSTQHMHWSL